MLRFTSRCIWSKILSFEKNPYFFAEIAILGILVPGLSEVISVWIDISASKHDIENPPDIFLHLVEFSAPLQCWVHTRTLGKALGIRRRLILHIFSSTKNPYLLMQNFYTENRLKNARYSSGRLNCLSEVAGNVLFAIYDHFGPIYGVLKILRLWNEKLLI